MKLLHLYIKKVMPNIKKKKEENILVNEEWDSEKILRAKNLDDFLNCEDTKQIMINEHYNNFETILKPRLENLYEKYNYLYRNEKFLGKDWDNISGGCFANLIYNYINVKYDLTIFYDCPALAIELLEKHEEKS